MKLIPVDARVVMSLVRALGNPYLFLWFAAVMLAPFYFFRSGTPQVGDYVLVLLFVAIFVGTRESMQAIQLKPARYLALFVIYVSVLTFAWYLWGGADMFGRFPISPLFYIFNFLVFTSVIALYLRYGRSFLIFTAYSIGLALLLQIALYFLVDTTTEGAYGRATLFFNNPNQLGYYALLSATLLAIAARFFKLSVLYAAAGITAAIYLALISLSKAAIFSIAFLCCVAFIKRRSVAVVILLSLALGLAFLDTAPQLVDSVTARLESVGTQEDDNLAGRGYDRILNHPEYWLFGAAEGAYRRFDSVLKGEIHSSPATLFFSYGFFGTGIFCMFLLYLFRGTQGRAWLLLVPTFLYGLTHNGLRFSLFWVVLAFFYCTQWELYRLERFASRGRARDWSPLWRQHVPGPGTPESFGRPL